MGKWVKDTSTNQIICGNCKHQIITVTEFDALCRSKIRVSMLMSRYCPFCGERMENGYDNNVWRLVEDSLECPQLELN